MAGILVAVAWYRDGNGAPYSPLNHFISELGRFGVSPAAPFFNGCLVVSGLLLIVFMGTLARRLRSRSGFVASAFGQFSAVSCSAVGLVPMNHLDAHVAIAFVFFYSTMGAIAGFNAAIYWDRTGALSKWLLVPGLIAAISLAWFNAIPMMTHVANLHLLVLHREVRPQVWPAAVLEWLVFLSVLAWILLVSLDLAFRQPTRK